MNQTFIEKRDLDPHQLEGADGAATKYLEVIYVADQYAIGQYGMDNLPEMMMSMGNTVRIAGLFLSFYLFLSLIPRQQNSSRESVRYEMQIVAHE